MQDLMPFEAAMELLVVCSEIRRVKGLLVVLEQDFETAGALTWALFTVRVDF
jgi:hypothetical protein